MGADDDLDCAGHVWRLVGLAVTSAGVQTEYVCVRCDGAVLVPEGGVHPETV